MSTLRSYQLAIKLELLRQGIQIEELKQKHKINNVFEIKVHDDYDFDCKVLIKEPAYLRNDRSQWKYTKNRHNFIKGKR